MNSTFIKMTPILVLFVFVLVSGYWLGHSGKPYGILIFTLHKLIALGALILVGINVYPTLKNAGVSGTQIGLLSLAALSFLATIISGGLLSTDKDMPAFVGWMHRLLPYLTLLSSLVTLYIF